MDKTGADLAAALTAGIDNARNVDHNPRFEAGVEMVRALIRFYYYGGTTMKEKLVRSYMKKSDEEREQFLTEIIDGGRTRMPVYWDAVMHIANEQTAVSGVLKGFLIKAADGQIRRKEANKGRPTKGAKKKSSILLPKEYDYRDMIIIDGMTKLECLRLYRNPKRYSKFKLSAGDAVVEAFIREGAAFTQ